MKQMQIRAKNGRIYEYDYSRLRNGRKASTHHPDFQYKESYKNEALRRANYQCDICAAPDKKLYVHHKDGLGEGETKNPNNDRGNLLVVCASCHMKLHKNGIFPDVKAIRQLREKGHTLQQIGEVFGISRQRIHQLLKSEVERLKKKAMESNP